MWNQEIRLPQYYYAIALSQHLIINSCIDIKSTHTFLLIQLTIPAPHLKLIYRHQINYIQWFRSLPWFRLFWPVKPTYAHHLVPFGLPHCLDLTNVVIVRSRLRFQYVRSSWGSSSSSSKSHRLERHVGVATSKGTQRGRYLEESNNQSNTRYVSKHLF